MLMLDEKNKYESTLHSRFIVRVLAPPFLALLVLFAVGLWQLNKILHKQVIDDLKRSATTTAVMLDREFSLRETVLKQTGSELFITKNEYNASRKKLDEGRDACRTYILQKYTYRNSTNGVCDPFLGGFTTSNAGLGTLENEYISLGEQLIQNQNQRINERLAVFKQLFPETLALVVVDENKQVVSSALSGVFKGSVEAFRPDTEQALQEPIRGKIISVDGYDMALFAYPIPGGSVLAGYDIKNERFIRQIWVSTPVDRTQAIAVILDAHGNPVYPQLSGGEQFKNHATLLRQNSSTELTLDSIKHTAVSAPVGSSNWLIAVASPTVAVFAPLRDAITAGVVIIGLFMIGFLWVGTFFIQRTLRNIVTLVSGAIVFGSGRLDYRISLDRADGEFLRLADTMNAMAQRIAAAEQVLDEKNRDFISVATHELRAPMTAIIGHLTMFKELYSANTDPKAIYMIDQAYYGTVRLRDLVNDMLNVAKLESGRSESALVPVVIKDVIKGVLDTMEVVAKMSKVHLEYHDRSATNVLADEARLRIIVNNFVSNAIKYNRPKGTVTVVHQHTGNMLITSIADNGLGIPEDQKEHMFEKFFRVQHDDRKNVTGTGLGMYIAHQYIQQMQGKLWFESVHGKGTTFYFSLPIAKFEVKHHDKIKHRAIKHKTKKQKS